MISVNNMVFIPAIYIQKGEETLLYQ